MIIYSTLFSITDLLLNNCEYLLLGIFIVSIILAMLGGILHRPPKQKRITYRARFDHKTVKELPKRPIDLTWIQVRPAGYTSVYKVIYQGNDPTGSGLNVLYPTTPDF